MFSCILGVNWIMTRTTSDMPRQWVGVGRRRRFKEDRWKCIPACNWWTLLKEKNERFHDGKPNTSPAASKNSR